MKLARYVAMFTVLSAFTTLLVAPATYAEDAPEPPIITVPDACATSKPDDALAPGFHFATNTTTNNPGLQWNWVFTLPETVEGEEPFVADTYSYAIYNGAALQTSGTLDIATTTLSYAAPAEGTYSLYLWTVEGVGEPSYCSIASISLDTTAPVITNNGYILDDKTAIATPLLTTEETGLTYSWTVDDTGAGVEVSGPTALTPNFKFLKDGTYNFSLIATDMAGNSTEVLLAITYLAPFVPPVTGPEIIPEETIPQPVQNYTPIEEAEPIAYESAPIPSGDGKLPPVVDASIYASTADGREALSQTEKEVVGPVTAGANGWTVLGLAWYWWVLIAAIIATAWLWILRTYRGRFADDI